MTVAYTIPGTVRSDVQILHCDECDLDYWHYPVSAIIWSPRFHAYGRPLDTHRACGKCGAVNTVMVRREDGSVEY